MGLYLRVSNDGRPALAFRLAALCAAVLVFDPLVALAAGAKPAPGFLETVLSVFSPDDAEASPVSAVPLAKPALRLNPLYPYEGGQQESEKRPAGSFRTVCVRLCDGYYWPVSDAAPMSRFQRDRAACESSCEQPSKLYFQPSGTSDAGKLMGLDGKPYAALPEAFAYRKSMQPSCRCRAEPWSASEMERHRLYAGSPPLAPQPVAQTKPVSAADIGDEPDAAEVADTDIQAGNPAAIAYAKYPLLDRAMSTTPDAQNPINALVLPPLTHPALARRRTPVTLSPASGPVQKQPVDGAGQLDVQLR